MELFIIQAYVVHNKYLSIRVLHKYVSYDPSPSFGAIPIYTFFGLNYVMYYSVCMNVIIFIQTYILNNVYLYRSNVLCSMSNV